MSALGIITLENMSWGFCRGKGDDDDKMAYLNVDKKLEKGGRGIEDILMADFLNTLSFMSADFLNKILTNSFSVSSEKPQVEEKFEVRGNAGNYYIPYEDEANGIRLAQPDGWISDGKNLFFLEAKGYRDAAALNKGQLAKEYLIAKNVATETGHEKFYILLIAENFDNVYKSGKEKYPLAPNKTDSFVKLWAATVNDLNAVCAKQLNEKMKVEKWQDIFAEDNVAEHFLWITWEEIKTLAKTLVDTKNDVKAEQIVKTINFHSTQSDEMPIFSQLLAKLAEDKEPLYKFFNGGCGNETVKEYEKQYLDAIGETDSKQAKRWENWHKLAESHADVLKKLSDLEDLHRNAAAALRDAQKQISTFYEKNIVGISRRNTTRKAFEILGDSSQLENTSNFFEQRCKTEIQEDGEKKIIVNINTSI